MENAKDGYRGVFLSLFLGSVYSRCAVLVGQCGSRVLWVWHLSFVSALLSGVTRCPCISCPSPGRGVQSCHGPGAVALSCRCFWASAAHESWEVDIFGRRKIMNLYCYFQFIFKVTAFWLFWFYICISFSHLKNCFSKLNNITIIIISKSNINIITNNETINSIFFFFSVL